MKTSEEVEELKRQWKHDPIWDIEQTEGFEDHRAELLQFRLECENQWERECFAQLVEKSERIGVPGNTAFAAYIETLECRIDELENKVEQLLLTVR